MKARFARYCLPVLKQSIDAATTDNCNHTFSQAGTYADVVVKLGLIKLLTRRFDVCEEAKKNDAEIQCPVEAGEYKITQTVALPREIPPGE